MKNNFYVIVINGAAQAGKDTIVSMSQALLSNSFYIENISTVDIIKKVAIELGWNGIKDERSRKFLSDLKDLSVKYNNGPFKYVCSKIDMLKDLKSMIFVHAREPWEIEKIKKKYHAITLLVRRPGLIEFKNHADMEVENFKYDYVINNKGTIENLQVEVSKFLKQIGAI